MPSHRTFPIVLLAALLVPAGNAAATHTFSHYVEQTLGVAIDIVEDAEVQLDPNQPSCDTVQECVNLCQLNPLCYARNAVRIAHALVCTDFASDGHVTVGVGLPPGEPCTLNVSTRNLNVD